MSLAEWQRKLKIAEQQEDYERCAVIRDKIKLLKEKLARPKEQRRNPNLERVRPRGKRMK
jgi:protein-arginine kinase activator protein McsA